ncbi:MAG: hypothetical protein R3E79_00185 [Caldilineaceae bacterium]
MAATHSCDVIEDGLYLYLRKADHLIEAAVVADIGADIEATGHIIHRHWRHAGDEEQSDSDLATGRPFEQVEEIAKKAAAMGQLVIGFLPMRRPEWWQSCRLLVRSLGDLQLLRTAW